MLSVQTSLEMMIAAESSLVGDISVETLEYLQQEITRARAEIKREIEHVLSPSLGQHEPRIAKGPRMTGALASLKLSFNIFNKAYQTAEQRVQQQQARLADAERDPWGPWTRPGEPPLLDPLYRSPPYEEADDALQEEPEATPTQTRLEKRKREALEKTVKKGSRRS